MLRTTPLRLIILAAAALLLTTASAQEGATPAKPSGLSQEAIRATVQSHTQAIRTCYQQALAADPDLAGQVKVQFTVEADGTVSTAHIQDSDLNADIEACLLADVRTWTFPAPASKVIVTYPFVFKASRPAPIHFSRDALKQAMRDNQDALQACNDEQTPGKLAITFTVQANGVVSDIATSSDTPTLAAPEIQSCVQGVITPWRFAPTQDGKDARITYPIVFK